MEQSTRPKITPQKVGVIRRLLHQKQALPGSRTVGRGGAIAYANMVCIPSWGNVYYIYRGVACGRSE